MSPPDLPDQATISGSPSPSPSLTILELPVKASSLPPNAVNDLPLIGTSHVSDSSPSTRGSNSPTAPPPLNSTSPIFGQSLTSSLHTPPAPDPKTRKIKPDSLTQPPLPQPRSTPSPSSPPLIHSSPPPPVVPENPPPPSPTKRSSPLLPPPQPSAPPPSRGAIFPNSILPSPPRALLAPPPRHAASEPPPPSEGASAPSNSSPSATNSTGVVIIALIATVLVLSRKKSKRPDVYPTPYVPPPNFTVQSDGYYYGQNSSAMAAPGQSDTFFPSQVPYSGSSLGSQRGKPCPAGGPESELLAGTKSFYSYEEVMEMTGGFAHLNIIGQGGFGTVYKGQLPDGRVVAVKQLKAGSGQGDREFRAEIEIISRVHHRHLVSLVGYCIQDIQRLLIYEFLPNKTLDYHLHGEGLPVLEWRKRVKIALGAAKGLAYLHEDCHPKIIHRDIKSSNILLDDAFESTGSNNGLNRYLAPEYASSGKLTDRSDVFSFGVVLLELITGRKPVDPTQPLGDESLVEWSRPMLIRALETGDVSEVVDPRLEKHYVESELLRMIEAAAACIRHSAMKRPRMAQVVRALDSDTEMSDLTNGVKYGQSTIYDSGQYSEDIMKFKRMAHGSNTSLDLGSSSREHASSGIPSAAWKVKDSSSDFTSCESETRAFTGNPPRVH
ncbi:hypothetical protein MLD38_009384 [Melastoma candidum]|uniref:Uncharacterized protein n=1 Tax=Melastoma candidum TaxID=119954 RepID=A0ACB9RYT3_9MYRT|nr:hypothetical protein MLD38_009384 [Melastoma candidum]